MVLVDTSVWIDVFRKREPLDLEGLIAFDEIVTCLPVVQEVLQGFRQQRHYLVARESFLSLPMVESPLQQDVWLEAADLFRTARRQGITVRSSADCLIAACAIRNALTVLHSDRDFHLLAQISPLEQRQLEVG